MNNTKNISDKWASNSKHEMELASWGKLCPTCKAILEDIKIVGNNYDGINLNIAYKCSKCGETWEGH